MILRTGHPQEKAPEMKDPCAFRQKVYEAARMTNTIESSFSQEKTLSVLSEKILSKGKFLFKKKNMLRWEYTDPFKYLIILNNGRILVKDDANENRFDASSNKAFREINVILLGCAQGTLLGDEKRFHTTYFESQNYYFVKLQPKTKELKDIFSGIYIYFDKGDYSVSRLVMYERSGDFTTIDFSAKHMNVAVSDEKFYIP
jgi:outer membrane lipoprotein-sorting protein